MSEWHKLRQNVLIELVPLTFRRLSVYIIQCWPSVGRYKRLTDQGDVINDARGG
jgi:hypothetical protein